MLKNLSYTNNMSDKINNYIEETKPLFRLLRTEAFRFIIVRYNHYSLVTRLKEDLSQYFPERSQNAIDARNANYRKLVDSYYKAESGFFFVENFDAVLANPEIYSGLNQRRDKLAMYPIALIVFISSSSDELFARQIMEKMPDLWSFRSLLLDLKVEISKKKRNAELNQLQLFEPAPAYHSSSRGRSSAKEKELNRLLKRVKKIAKNELGLQKALYEQIAKLYHDLYKHDEAIEYYYKLEQIAIETNDKLSLGNLYNKIGEIYDNKGEWDKAMTFLNKSLVIYAEEGDKLGLANVYSNIGLIHDNKGEWEKALEYLLKSVEYFSELDDKEGLAILYSNIGLIYSNKGDWSKAMEYYLKSEATQKEVDPNAILSATSNNIGQIYSRKGEIDKALDYFLKSENISSASNDKYGLGSIYNNIGLVYDDKGDWNRAIEYYLKSEKIHKEVKNIPGLVTTYFNIGVSFKNNSEDDRGNSYLILAGFIATKYGLKGQLSLMSWALDPIIQELGQEKFMEEGQKLYDLMVNQKEELEQ